MGIAINPGSPGFKGNRLDKIIDRVAEKCPDLPALSKQAASAGALMRPSQNRLYMGIFGLFLQTAVDFLNPHVDKETSRNSGCRTAAKMLVTTASGVASREVGQWIGDKLIKKFKLKPPEGILRNCKDLSSGQLEAELKYFGIEIKNKFRSAKFKKTGQKLLAETKYAQAAGNIAGIAAAVLSVFCVDMLLIDPLTNFVLKLSGKKKPESLKERKVTA